MSYTEIGEWSEAKLEIVRDYGKEYSKILHKQPRLSHAYIDAFAGAGTHVLKGSRRLVPGSPLNALTVAPPFADYHFVDVDGAKVGALREAVGERRDVQVYEGDCNDVLLRTVFPKVRYEDYRRALCLLDPYGLHLDWRVMETAGRMRTIEIFVNFPMMDITRNVLRSDPSKTDAAQAARLTRFWGDESWRKVAYASDEFLKTEYKVRGSRSALAQPSPRTPGRIARLGVAARTSAALLEKRAKTRSGSLPTATRTRDLRSPLVSPYVPHFMARFATNLAVMCGTHSGT